MKNKSSCTAGDDDDNDDDNDQRNCYKGDNRLERSFNTFVSE